MPKELTPAKVAFRVAARRLSAITRARRPLLFPTYAPSVVRRIEEYHDDVRYSSIALAIETIRREGIEGALAEVGVYQGATSYFINRQIPERDLYLFDTFGGFPDKQSRNDYRFSDTSMESVSAYLGPSDKIKFRKGYFPDTASGLENERFSFVMLDVDLYQPALDVFEFFYPRLVRGGYFFMHDFNSNESDYAISRASRKYMADKSELLMELPDYFGSAFFRKI